MEVGDDNGTSLLDTIFGKSEAISSVELLKNQEMGLGENGQQNVCFFPWERDRFCGGDVFFGIACAVFHNWKILRVFPVWVNIPEDLEVSFQPNGTLCYLAHPV